MDYIEAFQNLRTNNKYGRKSPHKAVLMLAIIEMFEQNVLSNNEIYYDDALKSMFLKVWNRVLPEESFFNSEAYLPFWFLQSDSFWHIVPLRGKEEILRLMKDNNVKPSESKLKEYVKYAELDEDLYFLMTIPSGRSSLKRTLLENYTNLSAKEIDEFTQKIDNTTDFSKEALSTYESLLSQEKKEVVLNSNESDEDLNKQFHNLNEDLQIELCFQYYSFLRSHRNERDMFKEICPTFYDLLDKILNNPVRQGDIYPSFAFTYDNFLSDLKISLISEDCAMDLINKISEAIDLLRGNINIEESSKTEDDDLIVETVYVDKAQNTGVYVDIEGPSNNVTQVISTTTENRRGKSWTEEEEQEIIRFFKQGKEIKSIATIVGRTEVAIKVRLAKLGLIDYVYGKEYEPAFEEKRKRSLNESDFSIENSLSSCFILNKYGEKVFASDGKLKYINGKLYRLNLKRECFTIKSMLLDDSVWIKGEKKIVAYPQTGLYRIANRVIDYCDVVEDIHDDEVFENCKLKFNGFWFNYKGELIPDESMLKETMESSVSDEEISRIKKSPLYDVRKQALLRAMKYFRIPVKIRDIARTISRSAWGATIKEEDVKDIINTISEVESNDDKYILKKK